MGKTNTAMFTKYWANFLSKTLKQTKAGPRSSGTTFLVITLFFNNYHVNFFIVDILKPFFAFFFKYNF